MRQPRYEQDQIEKAKAENLPLVALDIYDRFSAAPRKGSRRTCAGPLLPHQDAALREARAVLDDDTVDCTTEEYAKRQAVRRISLREKSPEQGYYTHDEQRVLTYLDDVARERGVTLSPKPIDPIGYLIELHGGLAVMPKCGHLIEYPVREPQQ